MKLQIVLFFSVLFLFSGCVSQEKQFQNKTDCLLLTSYSFQKIPECSSQKECFKKVETTLFDFPQTFSDESALALNSYKNNLASSWLYFNKSLVITKEINHLCATDNFSPIPKKTNELAFYIEKAFDFADKAVLDSFSFILLEKQFLEDQNITLIPEERLFDDFIIFNQNINELLTPEIYKQSDSYVSHYFKSSREFNEFSSEIGFYSLYLNEFTSTDLVGFYSSDAINLIKSDKFYVPLLKKGVSSVLSFLFIFDDLGRSLKILKKMPSHELFALFGNFVSTENSVAFHFSELVSNVSLHKTSLTERNQKLSSNTAFLISQSSSKLDELSLSSLNKFDSNILSFLFEELESNTISEREHDIFSVQNFVSDSKEKLFSIENELSELKKKQYFNEITLGETTSSLKKINSNMLSLNQDIEYYSTELFSELVFLCNSKTKSISSELNQINFSQKPFSIASLSSKIAVKISEYKSLEGEKKLSFCKEIISLNNELYLALEDQEKFFLKSEKSSEECFNSLEKIFYSKNLFHLVDSFYSLKSLKENNLDAYFISNSCIELKERVKNYLYSNDEEIKEINFLYSDSKSLLNKLLFLNKLFPEFFSSAKIAGFQEKLSQISGHFSLELYSFEFFPESSKDLSLLKELNKEMHLFFVSFFQEFLSSNSESKLVPLEESVLGKTFLARQKIFFPNPLNEKINVEFSLVSPKISGEILISDSCIEKLIQEESSSRILVSCIPENGLSVESDFNFLIPFTSSTELIEAAQDKILFKKTIKSDSPFSVSKIKAEIPLEFNADSAFVFFNSEKIPVSVDSKKAVFYLNNLASDSKIELFYSVSNPISLILNEESRTRIDENTFFMEFSVKAKNNLGFNFDSVKLSLSLSDFDLIQDIQLFGFFSKISFEKINGKIVFSVSLEKFQEKEFTLKFKLKNFEEYSNNLRDSIILDLSLLSISLNQEISLLAETLLEKTNSALELEELFELRKETDSLLLKENSSVETEFNSIKNSVEEKIDSLENNTEFFDSIGFYSESSQLKSELNQKKSELIDSLTLPKENALPLLYSINSSLEEFSDKNTETFLLDKRDSLIKKAKELSEKISLLQDKNLSDLMEKIFFQDENFFSLFSQRDYFNSGLLLKAIEEQLNFLENSFEEKIKEKKDFLEQKISFLEEKKPVIQSLFSALENALSESDFYLSPVTKKRLSFLKESFDELNFSFDSENASVEELLSAEKEFLFFEEKLTEIGEELDFSLNKMKEDAKVFLLSAKLSNAPEETISLAQKLFDQGKYIESINTSFPAAKNPLTGLLSLSSFELPLQIYPLLAVILFIAFKKFFPKKKKRKPKKKILACSV